MSFAAPAFLWVTGFVLAGTVIAHLFSRARPREMAFPTARFVPEGAAQAPTRARVPTDLVLLAVRLALVALIGAAFAQPRIEPSRREVVRVFAIDVSAHLADDAAARAAALDSVRALHEDGDVIVAFDTAVRRVSALDSVFRSSVGVSGVSGGSGISGSSGVAGRSAEAGASPAGVPGSLSAGLLGAMRAASAVAERADSLELVLVSPMHVGEIDSATMAIRALWPGRIRVIRSTGRTAASVRASVAVVALPNDPIRESVALAGGFADTEVRVVRTSATAADSQWAGGANRVLVRWPAPATGGNAGAQRAAGATSVGSDTVGSDTVGTDTVGAVVAGGRVVVAAFERPPVARGAAAAAITPGERVVARWLDGAPAAIERPHGAGCIRDVAVALPSAGDLAIRSDFVLFVRELLAPCGALRAVSPASDAVIARIAGEGGLAAAQDIVADDGHDGALAAWLLVAAVVLALVEHALRRRVRRSESASPSMPPAAIARVDGIPA